MRIEAMKKALEALKSSRFTKVTEATELIDQAIAEAEKQEPVAVKRQLVKIHDALCNHLGDTDPYIPEDMTDDEVCEYEPVFWAAKEIAALIGDAPWSDYTHPQPKREWVGLTDEEVIKCTPTWGGTVEDVARAIEAKLKEKNT